MTGMNKGSSKKRKAISPLYTRGHLLITGTAHLLAAGRPCLTKAVDRCRSPSLSLRGLPRYSYLSKPLERPLLRWMPMQLPPVGSRAATDYTKQPDAQQTRSALEPSMQRPPCPDRVASLVSRMRELDGRPADDEDPGSSR
jgi:hypothetical protein